MCVRACIDSAASLGVSPGAGAGAAGDSAAMGLKEVVAQPLVPAGSEESDAAPANPSSA